MTFINHKSKILIGVIFCNRLRKMCQNDVSTVKAGRKTKLKKNRILSKKLRFI